MEFGRKLMLGASVSGLMALDGCAHLGHAGSVEADNGLCVEPIEKYMPVDLYVDDLFAKVACGAHEVGRSVLEVDANFDMAYRAAVETFLTNVTTGLQVSMMERCGLVLAEDVVFEGGIASHNGSLVSGFMVEDAGNLSCVSTFVQEAQRVCDLSGCEVRAAFIGSDFNFDQNQLFALRVPDVAKTGMFLIGENACGEIQP